MQASRLAWSGRRFRTTVADLDRLWAAIPSPAAVTVVPGAHPQCLGAASRLVPPPRRAGHPGPARAIFHGPARVLLQAHQVRSSGLPDAGPAAAAAPRRAAPGRGTGARRCSWGAGPGCGPAWSSAATSSWPGWIPTWSCWGPAWHAAFGGDLASNTALRFIAAGYADPHTARRLGQARLTRFIWRYSHGHWGEELAARPAGAPRPRR